MAEPNSDLHRHRITQLPLPKHVAVIMDGNGRWAKERGEDRLYGHFRGVESVRIIVETAAELGLEYLTLYAFSTENWDRPADEVNGLMELLISTIRKEADTLKKNNIRMHVIGDKTMLQPNIVIELEECMEMLSKNSGLNLVMALSYSGKWDLVHATKSIVKSVESGILASDDINEATIQNHLSTSAFPNPELMIRTGGDYRISNFLLYQLAYSELFFTDTKWPDFGRENLYEAISTYQNRERRFGKTSDQINAL